MSEIKFRDKDGNIRAAKVIEAATGSWIGYLYANDTWSPYLTSKNAVMYWLQDQFNSQP